MHQLEASSDVKFSLPSFSFNSNSIVGLDIGSSSVKAVELALKGKGKEFELTHLGVAKLPSEAIVQGAFLNSAAIVDADPRGDRERQDPHQERRGRGERPLGDRQEGEPARR